MKRLFFYLIILVFTSNRVSAQTKHEQTGWGMFLNSTKLSDKWGLHLDVQARSGDNLTGVRNVLVRPGLTYFINSKQNVTVGYLLATTDVGATTLYESRIWQQYILNHKIGSVFASHRFRLEQRFLDQPNDNFMQRFRYFFRFIQPLHNSEGGFSKGAFLALQNETFFNVQNKDLTNGKLFDQNRVYLAVGYRLSKKMDLEVGYMNQAVNGVSRYTINNIGQLAVYTRF
ncbi:MAG: DUF2490 domain-containing protein [Pedobacter sp.]|nr:MAG: DUF2490 domain-containing protein [Pedobacter sp.]